MEALCYYNDVSVYEALQWVVFLVWFIHTRNTLGSGTPLSGLYVIAASFSTQIYPEQSDHNTLLMILYCYAIVMIKYNSGKS